MLVRRERKSMTPADDKPPEDGKAGENQASSKEILRMIEEYANDLRRIVKRLRKRLH